MKIFTIILVFLTPFGISAEELLRGKKTTYSLAESEGTKVQLTIQRDNPRMHVVRDYYTINISYSDGSTQLLPTFRANSNNFTARIDPQKHKNIALIVAGNLLVYSKDKNESTRVLILRNDLIKFRPKIEKFHIVDVVWTKGGLFCVGMFRDEATNGTSNFPFPFVSKMKIDENGTPRNHQLVWTTWHPKATPKLIPDAWTHKAGKPLQNSLLPVGNSLLWRCEGHWQTKIYPTTGEPLFKDSSWLSTNSETGVTTAGIIKDKEVLELIRKREISILDDLKKKLVSPISQSNKQRLEYLISTFSSVNKVKTDQASKQGGTNQSTTKSNDNE